MKYYVYVLLNTIKPGVYSFNELEFNYEPFYVGKGKGKRKYETLRDTRNHLKKSIINQIKEQGLSPIRVIISDNLSEEDAFNLEIKTIELIGRRDLNMGTLTNFTNGGEGSSGIKQSDDTKQKRNKSLEKYRFYFKTDEFKKTMSLIMNRRKHDPDMVSYYKMLSEKYMGQGNPMYGKKTSEKQKNGIRKAHMEGKIVLSEEGRLKIIETNRKQKGIKNINKRNDSKKYDLTSPLGENYAILGAVDLQKFCKENKLQYHVLKNNTGLITENMIIGKKINAKNTIGWKKN